jgi:hypothetical protein
MLKTIHHMNSNQLLQLAMLVSALAAGLTAVIVYAQDDAANDADIESAKSAAPAFITDEATLYAADGTTVLQEGTNGYHCFPDNPGSPDPDPACFDETWMALLAALGANEEADITMPGIAYMLAGGSNASVGDPFLTEPPEGEDWTTDPPHIMIVLPTGTDLSMYPSEHSESSVYVMWAGTPWEHLMIPVGLGEMNH